MSLQILGYFSCLNYLIWLQEPLLLHPDLWCKTQTCMKTCDLTAAVSSRMIETTKNEVKEGARKLSWGKPEDLRPSFFRPAEQKQRLAINIPVCVSDDCCHITCPTSSSSSSTGRPSVLWLQVLQSFYYTIDLFFLPSCHPLLCIQI